MGFLRDACGGDVYSIRSKAAGIRAGCPGWERHRPLMLRLGTREAPGGHHCSWCTDAEGIRTKLLSAQRADQPRWGDDPDKTRIAYIQCLIRRGARIVCTSTWWLGLKALTKKFC